MINKESQSLFYKEHRLLISMTMLLIVFLIFVLLFNIFPRIMSQSGFQINSARTYMVDDNIILDADMKLNFSAEVAEALENGIPLMIVVEVQLFRERPLWRNVMIKESQRLFELRYHPLTNIHEVTNMASGERYSFNSRQEAMAVLGMINGAHLINKNMLRATTQYRIQIRTFLDINYLPLALRQVAALSSSWYLRSIWYQWNIKMAQGRDKIL